MDPLGPDSEPDSDMLPQFEEARMIKKGTERLNQHRMHVAVALHAHGVRGQVVRTGLRRNSVETMAVSAKHGCKGIRIQVVEFSVEPNGLLNDLMENSTPKHIQVIRKYDSFTLVSTVGAGVRRESVQYGRANVWLAAPWRLLSPIHRLKMSTGPRPLVTKAKKYFTQKMSDLLCELKKQDHVNIFLEPPPPVVRYGVDQTGQPGPPSPYHPSGSASCCKRPGSV